MKIGGWRTRSVFERYAIVSQADIPDAVRREIHPKNVRLGTIRRQNSYAERKNLAENSSPVASGSPAGRMWIRRSVLVALDIDGLPLADCLVSARKLESTER
jgi:hypothetical protein